MVYNLMFTFSFQFISVYIDIPFFMYKYELYILYNLQILCLLTFKIIQVDGLFSGWKIKLVNLDHWRYFKKFQDKKKYMQLEGGYTKCNMKQLTTILSLLYTMVCHKNDWVEQVIKD